MSFTYLPILQINGEQNEYNEYNQYNEHIINDISNELEWINKSYRFCIFSNSCILCFALFFLFPKSLTFWL